MLGFVGRTAIHPRQLATIVECFTPSATQVADAAALLAAVEKAGFAEGPRRLKTCQNPRCRAAFYDRSRNNSGVWHWLKTCGTRQTSEPTAPATRS